MTNNKQDINEDEYLRTELKHSLLELFKKLEESQIIDGVNKINKLSKTNVEVQTFLLIQMNKNSQNEEIIYSLKNGKR